MLPFNVLILQTKSVKTRANMYDTIQFITSNNVAEVVHVITAPMGELSNLMFTMFHPNYLTRNEVTKQVTGKKYTAH